MKLKLMRPQECFTNCYRMLRRQRYRDRLLYAEGYCVLYFGGAFKKSGWVERHAWLVDKKTGERHEVTYPPEMCKRAEYFGKEFTFAEICKRMDKTLGALPALTQDEWQELAEQIRQHSRMKAEAKVKARAKAAKAGK